MIWRVVMYGLVLGGLSYGVHQWTTDRLGVLRFIYPVQALVSSLTVKCSPGAPQWMENTIKHAIFDEWALSNQLVFISTEGSEYRCESGWKGGMFSSPRLDEETRFRYASMTKLFTADAILDAEREGKLSLDDTLLHYLPLMTEVQDPYLKDITLGQLLRHSAGFDRKQSGDPMTVSNGKPWCPYDLSRLSKVELDFLPGTGSSYSNLGYCLLGVVLEKVYDKSYKQIVADKYQLSKVNMKFVNGDYFFDEVEYDFRNSDFFGENYTKKHDFKALASSAGMTGSARALAVQVRGLLRKREKDILSGFGEGDCDPSRLRRCFGYSLFHYQESDASLPVYIQSGYLYGVAGSVVIDELGGVTVRLGNGAPLGSPNDSMNKYIYKELMEYYR